MSGGGEEGGSRSVLLVLVLVLVLVFFCEKVKKWQSRSKT